MSPVLNVGHLGPTPYREGLALQEALVRLRAAAREGAPLVADAPDGDWLLYPDHPPVLTRGRGGSDDSLRVDRATLARLGVELFEVARGGDVTWHGPGQLVGYTIVDLDRRGRDLHRFLRDLEEALMQALEGWGIPVRRVPGRTGVWAGEEKIASIGVAVRRWVGYHGFALNVAPDLASFELIHPCGLRGVRMTSVAARLGEAAVPLEEARRAVSRALARRLEYDVVREVPAADVRALATRIQTITVPNTLEPNAA